jgi:hypothetical protein
MNRRSAVPCSLAFLNILLFGAVALSSPDGGAGGEPPCSSSSLWCDCVTSPQGGVYCAEWLEPVEDPLCSFADPWCF